MVSAAVDRGVQWISTSAENHIPILQLYNYLAGVILQLYGFEIMWTVENATLEKKEGKTVGSESHHHII